MIDFNNKALCPAPWVSLYVEPSGRVDNCCVGKNQLGNVHENSVKEILFGKSNQTVQQTMLDGTYPKGCAWCDNKSHNLQTRMFDIFPDRSEEAYQVGNFKLQYLDARWSNTCNLACTYCSPGYSSTWAQELNIPVRIDKQKKNDLLDYVLSNIETLKEVYLAGGEPLLMKENEQLIKAIRDRNPNCNVLVNTNLTQIANNSIFNNLLELKNCSWLVSIDDMEERFEYIRYPAKWSEFASNLELLTSNFAKEKIAFNMVFTSLNALTFWDAVDWVLSHGFSIERCTLALYNNGLTKFPLDVRSMPVAYQKKVLERMNHSKYQNMLGWKNTFDYLSELVEYSSLDLLTHLKEFDQRRNLNSKNTFPIIYEYLESKEKND